MRIGLWCPIIPNCTVNFIQNNYTSIGVEKLVLNDQKITKSALSTTNEYILLQKK